MIVARPLNGKEPCLIQGHEYCDLYLYDLGGECKVRQNAPKDGWCYDSLEMVSESIVNDTEELQFGWDAYLGDKVHNQWVGSSEV